MIYDDENLYKELLTMLKALKENISSKCPVCEKDIRVRYGCKDCNIEHMDDYCHRDGGHAGNCLLVKHLALIEIDVEGAKP